MSIRPDNRSPADIWFPEFRWLIDHAGWHALPAAPGDDIQGPDVRNRIGKDGVVFSAFPIPRGSRDVFGGRVNLDPPPQWAISVGLPCTVTVEELVSKLALRDAEGGDFLLLNSRLKDVVSYLRSADFARITLHRYIALHQARYGLDRSIISELQPEFGLKAMISLLRSSMSERRHIARYRRALSSLDGR